jgi:hypothetical protein
MLRQIFSTDLATLRLFLFAYQQGTGPRLLARLRPGDQPVEIKGVRQVADGVEVQTQEGTWHRFFACYKEEE